MAGPIADFILDQIIEKIVDEICEGIAGDAVNEAMQLNGSSPANAGQERLAEDLEPDIMSSFDDVKDGEGPIILSTDHPEAWGIVTDQCSEILTQAAEVCKAIRDSADAASELL